MTSFLAEFKKVYSAEVVLGVSTDTYDAQGVVLQEKDPSYVKREQVEEALAAFRGTIEQTPPMYSAVKYGGRRLYELARQGIEVERKKRKAYVSSLKLVAWTPPSLTLKVECGKGTYIRSIAHDLGQLLMCGAHLKKLVRLACGPFQLDDAIAISELQDSLKVGYLEELLYPLDIVLLHWKAAIIGQNLEHYVLNGRHIKFGEHISGQEHPQQCRAYTLDGRFIALLNFDEKGGSWKPVRVFLQETFVTNEGST